MNKIHLLHPQYKSGYHACGLGDPLPNCITADIEKVTCCRCLETTAAKNRLPGRPATGMPVKVNISIKLSPDMIAWIDSQGLGRTAVITAALTAAKEKENKENNE